MLLTPTPIQPQLAHPLSKLPNCFVSALLQKFSIVVLDTAIMHEKKCSRVVFLAL